LRRGAASGSSVGLDTFTSVSVSSVSTLQSIAVACRAAFLCLLHFIQLVHTSIFLLLLPSRSSTSTLLNCKLYIHPNLVVTRDACHQPVPLRLHTGLLISE